MLTFSLVPHPDHPPLGVRGVQVEIIAAPDDLLLTYRVLGGERVIWPEWMTSQRADELWRTTCFELFLMFDDQEQYVEFNFSPSTQWASYAFVSYREHMTQLKQDVDPVIDRLPDGVEVDCDLGGVPNGELRMGLMAVIEEEGGVRSFWSLAHPPGPPDFHHPACFAAHLPPPAWP